MKFCYCPDCKELRPRSWYRRSNCMLCGKDCRIIPIPISIYGYLMYALSTIGAIFVGLEFMDIDVGLGEARLYVMFGSIILALVFSAIEIGRATDLAMAKVGKVR